MGVELGARTMAREQQFKAARNRLAGAPLFALAGFALAAVVAFGAEPAWAAGPSARAPASGAASDGADSVLEIPSVVAPADSRARSATNGSNGAGRAKAAGSAAGLGSRQSGGATGRRSKELPPGVGTLEQYQARQSTEMLAPLAPALVAPLVVMPPGGYSPLAPGSVIAPFRSAPPMGFPGAYPVFPGLSAMPSWPGPGVLGSVPPGAWTAGPSLAAPWPPGAPAGGGPWPMAPAPYGGGPGAPLAPLSARGFGLP